MESNLPQRILIERSTRAIDTILAFGPGNLPRSDHTGSSASVEEHASAFLIVIFWQTTIFSCIYTNTAEATQLRNYHAENKERQVASFPPSRIQDPCEKVEF